MSKKLTLTWTNPNPNTNLHHIEIWRKLGSGGTYTQIGTDIMTITAGAVLTYEDTNAGAGLTEGAQYFYQIRAYNATGEFTYVEANTTISIGDVTAPIWTTASFNVGAIAANIIVLPVNEALDITSTPALSAFSVNVASVTVAVTSISLATANQVRLTIASAVPYGATVAVDYVVPLTNQIKDLSGNLAPALPNVTVTNTVPAGVDVYDFMTVASTNEATGTAGFNSFSGVTITESTEQALIGTKSIKFVSTAAGAIARIVPASYLTLGGIYDFYINHITTIPSATTRTFSLGKGLAPQLDMTLVQTPSQWREVVKTNVCCVTTASIESRIGIGDSGSNLYFDKIKMIKTGQLTNLNSTNLYTTVDAANDDSNVVSAGWGHNLNSLPVVETTDAYAGTRCLKLTKTGTNFASSCFWQFSVEANTYYKVSFYYKTVTVTDGTPSILQKGNMLSAGSNIQTFTTAAGWRLCEAILKSTTAGTGGFEILLGTGSTTGTVFLIDQISIIKQTL